MQLFLIRVLSKCLTKFDYTTAIVSTYKATSKRKFSRIKPYIRVNINDVTIFTPLLLLSISFYLFVLLTLLFFQVPRFLE